MAYIGKDLVGILSHNKEMTTMTGDGSTTTLTLTRTPGSVNNVEVYMDGIFQTPGVEYTLMGDTITFTSAPDTGIDVVAMVGQDSIIVTPETNTITGSKIVDGSITDAKIATGFSSSKLSGTLPAVDGSALTNLSSNTVTKNANDPATDTNPSNGVGSFWINTTSGEAFVCTDATTDANVWTNIGSGEGDVEPYSWLGTTSSYTAGGRSSNVIDKFSFTTDGNATDVGDLTATQGYPSGHHSATAGYIAGMGASNLDKMAFASEGNSTDVANIAQAIDSPCNHSTSTHGWMAGSYNNDTTMIMKFTFATDSDAVDSTKNLTSGRGYTASSQDGETYGYVASGYSVNGTASDIDRYSFSDSNHSSDVGTLTNSWGGGTVSGGSSSTTHGYIMGSGDSQPATNHIEKYAFASSSNGTDVGNLSESRRGIAGSGSTTHIYAAGGYAGAGPDDSNYKYTIDKRATASDGDSSDIGDLSYNRHGGANFQK